jgi:predicted transcriptional regulator
MFNNIHRNITQTAVQKSVTTVQKSVKTVQKSVTKQNIVIITSTNQFKAV